MTNGEKVREKEGEWYIHFCELEYYRLGNVLVGMNHVNINNTQRPKVTDV